MLTAAGLAAGCSGDQPSAGTAAASPVTTVPVTASTSSTLPVGPTVSSPITAPADLPVFEPAPIEWEPFNDAVDVATIEVPVDYAQPEDGRRIELFLARYRALDQENRIGTLLVNPGGPGFGGTGLAVNAADIYDRALRDRFDIIGWDPRGTGESEPAIDCIDSFDPYFTGVDSTPTDDAERAALVALAEQFAGECVAANPDLVHMTTNNSARDIDTIRRALGEETISFFGFSYGSELGTAWATMYPSTVRALVIDGAADPGAAPDEWAEQQLTGFDSTLTTFLDQCSADDGCEFHNDGDAAGAFDTLMASLDVTPIAGADGRPPVNRDIARVAVSTALYSELRWPALAQSLTAAQSGDGSGLLALFDAYYQRSPDGTWGNELEAFQVISCMDDPARPSVEESDAEAARLSGVVPRLVAPGSAGDYGCTFFPPAVDPRITITAAGAGPVLVVGTTGDPATPLASTRAMRDALDDGRLVVVTADEHTGYGVNRCIVELVNDYLIDLEPPDDETECT